MGLRPNFRSSSDRRRPETAKTPGLFPSADQG
jgi:hypothetical protein